MLKFIAFLLLLWVLWLIFGKRIQAWATRYIMRRVTRMAARQAGIDPDLFSGNRSARNGEKSRSQTSSPREEQTASRHAGQSRHTGPLIPKEYAEDVEYTEIRSYSSETVIAGDETESKTKSPRTSVFRKGKESIETQVSDAEIISITKE